MRSLPSPPSRLSGLSARGPLHFRVVPVLAAPARVPLHFRVVPVSGPYGVRLQGRLEGGRAAVHRAPARAALHFRGVPVLAAPARGPLHFRVVPVSGPYGVRSWGRLEGGKGAVRRGRAHACACADVAAERIR